MRRSFGLGVQVVFMLLGLISIVAAAGTPPLMNYQGWLRDDAGDPVTGTFSMTFKIWTDELAGAEVWSEDHPSVTVTNGGFSVVLGTSNNLDNVDFAEEGRWLEVTVDGETMIPRTRLTTLPYAFRISTVDSAQGGLILGDLSVRSGGAKEGVRSPVVVTVGSDDPANPDPGRLLIYNNNAEVVVDLDGYADGRATIGNDNTNTGAYAFVAGTGSSVTSDYSGISGGQQNSISGENSCVGGGKQNSIDGNYATIGGGISNTVVGQATVGGGSNNTASASLSTIGGGYQNATQATSATVAGGANNVASGNNSTVAGGADNMATATWSTVGGGSGCTAEGWYCTVAGGTGNSATMSAATVSGGGANLAEAAYAAIGGGRDNVAGGDTSATGGGAHNAADGCLSVIGGGQNNSANGHASTIGGGYANTTILAYTTVAGGSNNGAQSEYATVCGGLTNVCQGQYSVIPGGQLNTVMNATHCMAFGRNVYVNDAYTVALFDGDFSGEIGINRDDQTVGGIAHPIHVGTNENNGNEAHLTVDGFWTDVPKRSSKSSSKALDPGDVLNRIDALPIENWESKGSGNRHICPYAEDFHEQFEVGTLRDDGTRDNQHLAAADIAGVALIGVQELHRITRELEQKTSRIGQLEMELAQLQALVELVLAQQSEKSSGSSELARNR